MEKKVAELLPPLGGSGSCASTVTLTRCRFQVGRVPPPRDATLHAAKERFSQFEPGMRFTLPQWHGARRRAGR